MYHNMQKLNKTALKIYVMFGVCLRLLSSHLLFVYGIDNWKFGTGISELVFLRWNWYAVIGVELELI